MHFLSNSGNQLFLARFFLYLFHITMSLNQRIVEQNAIDRALLIKNDRVGRNARPRVNKVKKNLTGVDEELLKDYQQAHPQSFEYIDEQGNTKYRKYMLPNLKPELLPEVETIPESELKNVKELQEKEKERILGIMEHFKQELDNTLEQQKQLTEYINQGSTRSATYNRNEPQRVMNLNRDKKEMENLKAIEIDIRTKIAEGINLLQDVDSRTKQIEQEAYDKNAEASKIKKTNKELVDKYRDELNFLNQGAFSTEKADNESEMEYLERLQRNAQIEAPEYQLEDAKFETIGKFREKMREIIRDPVLIEQVINSLDSFGEVDNKAILLKSWNLVKSKFLQTYGANNKNITVNDIIAFFQFFLETGESGLTKAVENVIGVKGEKEASEVPFGFREGLNVFPFPSEDYLFIENPTAGGTKRVFLRAVNDGSKNFLLYSFTGEKGSYKQFFDKDLPSYRKGSAQPLSSARLSGKSSAEIERETGITPERFNSAFDYFGANINPSNIATKMQSKYGIRSISIADQNVLRKPYSTEARVSVSKAKNIEYGMGLHAEEIPARVPFGNVNLLLKKLYYHNELSVKNKQDKSIAGLRTTKVSEAFVKLIVNMLKGLHPTHSDLNHLPIHERQLYDRLIQVANLNKSMPHQGDRTIQELKKRLKLIEGEIEIGNNNPMLVKEIYSILHSLKDFKSITQSQIDKYMAQFK